MDNLDRMFRHLVRTIEARYRDYLTGPFEVAELYQTILPYRLHRRELGLETNQDYEITLLELLSGARGYLVVDERMRDAFRKELGSANPDPTVLRDFAAAHVALASDAVRRLDTPEERDGARLDVPGSPASSGVTRQPRARTTAGSSTLAQEAGATPTAGVTTATVTPRRGTSGQTRTIAVAATGEPCRFCGGALPAGRQITYCPHCGQNLTVVNCAACGTELELGWGYCTTCGRAVGE